LMLLFHTVSTHWQMLQCQRKERLCPQKAEDGWCCWKWRKPMQLNVSIDRFVRNHKQFSETQRVGWQKSMACNNRWCHWSLIVLMSGRCEHNSVTTDCEKQFALGIFTSQFLVCKPFATFSPMRHGVSNHVSEWCVRFSWSIARIDWHSRAQCVGFNFMHSVGAVFQVCSMLMLLQNTVHVCLSPPYDSQVQAQNFTLQCHSRHVFVHTQVSFLQAKTCSVLMTLLLAFLFLFKMSKKRHQHGCKWKKKKMLFLFDIVSVCLFHTTDWCCVSESFIRASSRQTDRCSPVELDRHEIAWSSKQHFS